MAFDKFLKQLFKKISHNKAVSGYSIGTLEKSIDVVFKPGKDVSDIQYLPECLKKPLNHYIIEFKSDRDLYDFTDIAKTAMYKWGYCHNEKVHPERFESVQACLLVVEKMAFVEELIQSTMLKKTSISGVYAVKNDPIQYFIVINELELKKENLGLLINASGDTMKKLLPYLRTHGYLEDPELNKYIFTRCYLINVKGDEELMTEIEKVLKNPHEESIKHAVEIVGMKKIIDTVGLDKVIDSVGLDKVIDSVGLDKVIDSVGSEKIINFLRQKHGSEEFQKLLEKNKE